ncbi:MAG: regulatory protein RecX [Lachnospiraceae bacterium]|nr:regulatory protein RecX [Lachnospiraceae bacterium]
MEELVRAKRRALYLLADMDRTEKELYDKLKKTGYSEETVSAAMEYVKSFGYIDDARYARVYIESYRNKKSRMKMTYDMAAKGVDREVIEDAFLEYPEYDETELIRHLAEKKLRGASPAQPEVYQKTAAYLARRGFASGDIVKVLKSLELRGEDPLI